MVSGGNVGNPVSACSLVTDESQDDNIPAVVSLAAGGVAGGVEGFLSVRPKGEFRLLIT